MRICKSPTILVPFESWMFLQEKGYQERCGKQYSEILVGKMTRSFQEHSYQGYKQLMNGDLGGGNGNPENAWEEHRWTSWSVNDMKKILEEAGLPWKDGEEAEYITVSI